MEIKIIRYTNGALEKWYEHKIGETFELHEPEYSYNIFYYWVKTDKGINVINVNDVE